MKRYSYKEKADGQNIFIQKILNQFILSSLILFGVLILNLTPSMEKFKLNLKSSLDKNISFEQIKDKCKYVYDFVEEKFFNQDNYFIDEKIIKQINEEENKINAVKKNFIAYL